MKWKLKATCSYFLSRVFFLGTLFVIMATFLYGYESKPAPNPSRAWKGDARGESGVEQKDEMSGRTEKRRGGVENGGKRIDQGWITGWVTAVQCWAEAHWEKLNSSETHVLREKHELALITLMSDGLKTLHNVPFSNVTGCAETFFWTIRTWTLSTNLVWLFMTI